MSRFDLSKFISAHKRDYETALREITAGKKQTHWMWYIFPQIEGLGRSPTAVFYALRDQEEAKAFLRDEYLGGNLREISERLLTLSTDDPNQVFGFPDDLKLRSSMTLFASISEAGSVFHRVLDKYFGGVPDPNTLALLSTH